MSIESSSNASGNASSQLSFVAGTDPDTAQMQVQNKLQQAVSRLPQAVQAQGVRVTKAGTDLLMVVTLNSDDPAVTSADMGDYLQSTLVDIVSRIEGVGDVNVFGSGYAMRIWLDPVRLQRYALVPGDIRAALLAQNTEVSAGQIGALAVARGPAADGHRHGAGQAADGRGVPQGRAARAARRIGAAPGRRGARRAGPRQLHHQHPQQRPHGRRHGHVSGQRRQCPGHGRCGEGQARRADALLPARHAGHVTFDTTPFVRCPSKGVVVTTLAEAMVLVVAIMYLFMQNLRATLIPAIAVPVVLLGTMGVLAVAGFSINTLTMFGLVLAIGLLVDDAIVVVENVERLMREEGLSPATPPAQHGRNQRRAGGHRGRAVGGVHPDGLLRRLHRRHLPPVQHHRGECHGVVGAGGDEPVAGAVRDAAQARASG
jgi:hypothetical protein